MSRNLNRLGDTRGDQLIEAGLIDALREPRWRADPMGRARLCCPECEEYQGDGHKDGCSTAGKLPGERATTPEKD